MGNTVKEGHLGGFKLGGNKRTYTPEIWERIVNRLGIKSVIDVGCGDGHNTEWFIQQGIDAIGVDGSTKAKGLTLLGDKFILHDFTKGPLVLDRQFDLGFCSEFVEHVPEENMENFLAVFDRCKYILMTHAVPRQKGYHHVNCQTDEYWKKALGMHGFKYHRYLSNAVRNIARKKHYTFMHRSGMFFWNRNKAMFLPK